MKTHFIVHPHHKPTIKSVGYFLTPICLAAYVRSLLYNKAMDDLASLLANKGFDEPPEIAAIKRYVEDTYKSEVSVQVRDKDIIIMVQNAALASRLRFDTSALKAAAATDKRIIFRIIN
jgi:hypothetical protein